MLLVWHFSINLKKKKKDLTLRIDQLLKFSSNKSVGKLNPGRGTEREAAAVYSELPTLARVQRDAVLRPGGRLWQLGEALRHGGAQAAE